MTETIKKHLNKIINNIGPRPVGSPKNLKAQDYIADVLMENSLVVDEPEFECIDWVGLRSEVIINSTQIRTSISPFSMPCEVKGKMCLIKNILELEKKDFSDRIAVLAGELTKEAIMPKNFTFYNPDQHKKIIKLLEKNNPKAIITIAQKDENVFPIFEDGDFYIPSVYTSKGEGNKIVSQIEHLAELKILSQRKKSRGANVIGFKRGQIKKKIVLFAHFDTKANTPGAIDNASGTAVLLRVAEQIKEKNLEKSLEIVAFNGEDYYSVPGQMDYLKENEKKLDEFSYVINVDGVGIKDRKIGVAYINFSRSKKRDFLDIQSNYENLKEITPWMQGDHSIFTLQGIPAVAITSANSFDLIEKIIHTSKDSIEKVDPCLLEETANFIVDILGS